MQKLAIPENILIGDMEKFQNILYKLKQGGPSQLQVVTDFDYTLSTFWKSENVRNPSSHGILEQCKLFSKHYHDNASQLQKIYYPMEISTTLTREEKMEKMDEWWNKAHALLIEEKVTKNDIMEAVKDADVRLRPSTTNLIKHCVYHKIPVLVFSAGLADVLDALLEVKCGIKVEKNSGIELISNKMVFNEKQELDHFSNDLITSLTKNMRKMSYAHRLKNRPNIILMGDNIGDLDMSQGMEFTTRLTVGFLNDDIEERKQQYVSNFDIVIVGDTDLDFVNTILEYISHDDALPSIDESDETIIELPATLG
ncbi:hypothetical protein WA158_004955 [Blastocystis sp. Blastoise]